MTELAGWTYLGSLLFSLGGLALADRRFKLAFFYDWRRALKSLLPVYALLLAWDAAGIGLGIFFIGQSRFDSGVILAPEMPLEEPFFLALLVYVSLILYRMAGWIVAQRSRRGQA